MEIYDSFSVFTPTSPARLTFIERESVNSRLVDALRTPGMQIVVYGHSGSGKTTLLVNKLHQLYSSHITSRCMTGETFEQLVLDGFDQLGSFYSTEFSMSNSENVSASVNQDYLTLKNQISASSSYKEETKQVRVLPPQLTAQALARFMGEAGTCWVLEDFHKIDESERNKLSQIMKVFMDMADEYKTLKIIAIGAVDTARQVVDYDPEMKHRVSEILIPLMTTGELERIITKGGELLNIKFDDELNRGISEFSNGMASVCHQLCLNVCTEENINQTFSDQITINSEHLNTSLHKYLDQSSDSIKKVFDAAFKQKRAKKFDNSKIIIKALSELSQEGASRAEILTKILYDVPEYPQGNLTRFLKRLCSQTYGGTLRYDAVSGKYSFKDPIYRVFAMAYFSKNEANTQSSNKNLEKDIDIVSFLSKIKFKVDVDEKGERKVMIKMANTKG